MKLLVIFSLLVALAGCAPTEPKAEESKGPDAKADMDAVNKLRDDFIAAFNANDAVKIGDLYADNAAVMPGDGSPTVQGRAAIVERNKGFFDQATANIALTPSQTMVSGDLAFDTGTFRIEMTPKAGKQKAATEEGRYLVVLHREADGWKVLQDIDNVSKPAAAK